MSDEHGRRGRTGVILLTAAATTAVLVGAGVLLLQLRPVRARLDAHVSETPPLTTPGHLGLRHVLLARRDHALGRGELAEAAAVHGDLAQEALVRADAVHKWWLARRDPETKLYPQDPGDVSHWNYRNTAADFFAFHLHAGIRLNPAALDSLRETLRAEAALVPSGALPRPVDADSGEAVDADHEELVFAASEYVKDGLISVYERFGPDVVGERMLAVLDAVVEHSKHPSKFGPVPGTGAEVNGNLLQVCSRLSFSVDRPKYAEMAARLAEAYVQQAMPANHGIPPDEYDFKTDRVVVGTLKLKDHGNEVISGLSEAYAMAVARAGEDPAWRDRADRWAEPLAKMYELLLEHGVDADGIVARQIEPATLTPDTSKRNDNWGYPLNGALLFTQAARRHGALDAKRLVAIDARVEQIVTNVLKTEGLDWAGGMDGYADALESALYMAAHLPHRRAEVLGWVDRQIEYFYSPQEADGSVVEMYLDGNFIRTSSLYADARTGGWRAVPWRADVRIGYATDGRGNASLAVTSSEPWEGKLVADPARHRTIMRLPWDWPRLNSWPEWGPPPGTARAVSAEGLPTRPTPDQLGSEIPLSLPAHGEVRLTLTVPPVAPTSAPATTTTAAR